MHAAKPRKILAGLIAVIALGGALRAQSNPQRQPIARIGDQPIYQEDLLPSIEGQLYQLKNQEYELELRALTDVLNERLLAEEAKNKGLSTDALLEQMVDRTLPQPSAAEVEAYYLAQKDRINRPLGEVKAQLQQALMQARREQSRQNYLDQLRRKAAVTILLSPPRVEVTADPLRLRGNPDAPITIVEFGDFQCPYCRAVQQTLKQIMDKYQGKVRLGFRDFPLRQIHPQAQEAAEASRCAEEQGKFWEYHDLLFADQNKLDPKNLLEQANTAGLDRQRFLTCMDSGKFRSLIDNDVQFGVMAGVPATPAFYINGVPLTGAQPLSAFESIIDSELARAQSKTPAH